MFFYYLCIILAGIFIFSQFNIQRIQGQAIGGRPLTCELLTIPNGRSKPENGGRQVRYKCKGNFKLYGSPVATCDKNGLWNRLPPRCVKVGCPTITLTEGLEMVPQMNGAVLTFACTNQRLLDGPSLLSCNGRQWSNKPPTCTRCDYASNIAGYQTCQVSLWATTQSSPATTEFAQSCDFENGEPCDWQNDFKENIDWFVQKGCVDERDSICVDRTLQNEDGHYLRLESTKGSNQTGILWSSPFKTSATVCMHFFYRLSENGRLRVVTGVQQDEGSDDDGATADDKVGVTPTVMLCLQGADNGSVWRQALVTANITAGLQVALEGWRGASDDVIIVDDIVVDNCLGNSNVTESVVGLPVTCSDMDQSGGVTSDRSVNVNVTSSADQSSPTPTSSIVTNTNISLVTTADTQLTTEYQTENAVVRSTVVSLQTSDVANETEDVATTGSVKPGVEDMLHERHTGEKDEHGGGGSSGRVVAIVLALAVCMGAVLGLVMWTLRMRRRRHTSPSYDREAVMNLVKWNSDN